MHRNWFALTVRPQHEKSAACALRLKGLEHFLPVYLCRRRWSDRLKQLELPLFVGYVFCRFAIDERVPVLTTPGVVSIVGFGGRPVAVEDEEIDGLRRMAGSGLPLEPWPFLKAGQRVRIECGPLCGLEGMLVRAKDLWRVIVSVELLQRSVAVEVDRGDLAPAHPTAYKLQAA